MSKEDQYRARAEESFELALRARRGSDKSRWLSLAEKWIELADRARMTAQERLRPSASKASNLSNPTN
jgi:hypothetical protein